MAAFHVQVRVMPRATLLDPQGKAVEHALGELGFAGVAGVRVGRALTFTVAAPSEEAARAQAADMCRRLLANPVTEDYDVFVGDAP
jgi:phosphoribosylformylglycinamidine synthase subunit PurS